MNVAFRMDDIIRFKTDRGVFEGIVDYIDKQGSIAVIDSKVFNIRFNVSNLSKNDDGEMVVADGTAEVRVMVDSVTSTILDLIADTKHLQPWQKLALAHDHLGDLGVRLFRFETTGTTDEVSHV